MVKKDLLSLLEKAGSPISVPEILHKITANKTTIYRHLEKFVKEGRIQEVEFGDGKKRYEVVKDHHHHLVCKNCGEIEDVKIKESLLFSQLRKTSFKVQNHSIEFFGLCIKCQ